MGFPYTAVSQKKQSDINLRIFIQKTLHKDFGILLRFVIRQVGFQITMLVAFGNSCFCKKPFHAC